MRATRTVLRGVVHGRTIELEDDAGVPDGEEVSVTIQPVPKEQRLAPGEGLRRSFGAWAEDAEELDRYLEWNRQQRKIGRPEVEP
jgi:hypothetical protein